jgi:hypothetical protein
LPTFKPAEAVVQLKRQLRDLRLTERGNAYELAGQTIAELVVAEGAIEARLAKRPAVRPEWTKHRLASAADVRRFLDTVKAQLARWRQDD